MEEPLLGKAQNIFCDAGAGIKPWNRVKVLLASSGRQHGLPFFQPVVARNGRLCKNFKNDCVALLPDEVSIRIDAELTDAKISL
jgi:hypothetical protein